jgi:glycine hydroxymethyltransferase
MTDGLPMEPDPLTRSADETRAQLGQLVTQHEGWRARCLNLTASENVLSPAVHAALDSDLVHRYADYTGRDLSARRYRGTRFVVEIEREVERLAKDVFRAEFVELRPLSGHIAGIGVVMAFCRPGDIVLEIGREGGGHREAGKFSGSELIDLDVRHLPFDPARYNVDAVAAAELVERLQPRMVILGSSNFLFPHPVREMRQALDGVPGGLLVYDASHVLGLVAAGRFQDPLSEGADVVFGSTHKTFPGPQGGIVYSNRSDLMDRVSEVVYPGLVTNHHPFRLPALGVALTEMIAWGGAYADQVIANTQALGAALSAAGIPCVSAEGLYSRSHTILLRVAEFGSAEMIARRLEDASIITTAVTLPEDLGSGGIRIGMQEMTRRGLTHSELPRVGQMIADAIHETRPADTIAAEVAVMVGSLGPLRFAWPA